MDHLPELGTDISKVIVPTLKAYEPLLRQNADFIRSVPKETHRYGATSRQVLDVYPSPKRSLINGRQPIIMFLYGGGLVQGNRSATGYAEDLCHANMAAFFALRCGYTTVVPDYRLVYAHDARFPSGGEDVALAVEWLFKNADAFGPHPIDLFIMGNSAGGVHLSTFLLLPAFAETRAKILHGSDMRLRGVILLSVPFHFQLAHDSRSDALKTYFGDIQANAPLALLKAVRENGSIDFLQSGLRLFILNGELDPEDEIMQPRDDFIKEWLLIGSKESRSALAIDIMPGHNHISPFCSLGTGLEQEEAWGLQVSAFCYNVRKIEMR